MLKVLSVFGTRPEAIKMAPVIKVLERASHRIQSTICVTAQHREMLDQVLGLFKIAPDYDLSLMTKGQTLAALSARILEELDPIVAKLQPDWILVQGDTTTTMIASLVGYYRKVRIGHIEAGLRTHDKWQPFPEEINRRITGTVADLHFAPTEGAKENLLSEGVDPSAILTTGNTVIDALRLAADVPFQWLDSPLRDIPSSRRIILVTTHRRESFGAGLERICSALKEIAQAHSQDTQIVYPVHPNPNVKSPVHQALGHIPNVTLLPPLDYFSFVHLLKRCYLVLTDSGGIQEEAPSLGKPVLVLRDTTERPEAVQAGTATLIGTETRTIVSATLALLNDELEYARYVDAKNPFGDGHAAERIVEALR